MMLSPFHRSLRVGQFSPIIADWPWVPALKKIWSAFWSWKSVCQDLIMPTPVETTICFSFLVPNKFMWLDWVRHLKSVKRLPKIWWKARGASFTIFLVGLPMKLGLLDIVHVPPKFKYVEWWMSSTDKSFLVFSHMLSCIVAIEPNLHGRQYSSHGLFGDC